jgi:hypothetical protein
VLRDGQRRRWDERQVSISISGRDKRLAVIGAEIDADKFPRSLSGGHSENRLQQECSWQKVPYKKTSQEPASLMSNETQYCPVRNVKLVGTDFCRRR